MSYAWQLSRGSNTDPSRQQQQQSASHQPSLGAAAVQKPLTPPSVRNVTPSICLSVIEFRALMQEYRSLDDLVTTRLNRTLANSRASGLTSSPSLLSKHVASTSSLDLGKSTYATAPEQACLTFWNELVNVWIGREEVLQYCLKVEEQQRLARGDGSLAGGANAAVREEWLLDRDVDRRQREESLSSSTMSDATKKSKAKYDAFDSRDSRTEGSSEALRRQLKNELSVEAIIRRRSLDVFKSRCRFFSPSWSDGERGQQERAMWEGRDTRAGEEARM